MQIETDNLTPLYLRDLNDELRATFWRQVVADPVLKEAYERGDDIRVGWWSHGLAVQR